MHSFTPHSKHTQRRQLQNKNQSAPRNNQCACAWSVQNQQRVTQADQHLGLFLFLLPSVSAVEYERGAGWGCIYINLSVRHNSVAKDLCRVVANAAWWRAWILYCCTFDWSADCDKSVRVYRVTGTPMYNSVLEYLIDLLTVVVIASTWSLAVTAVQFQWPWYFNVVSALTLAASPRTAVRRQLDKTKNTLTETSSKGKLRIEQYYHILLIVCDNMHKLELSISNMHNLHFSISKLPATGPDNQTTTSTSIQVNPASVIY